MWGEKSAYIDKLKGALQNDLYHMKISFAQ